MDGRTDGQHFNHASIMFIELNEHAVAISRDKVRPSCRIAASRDKNRAHKLKLCLCRQETSSVAWLVVGLLLLIVVGRMSLVNKHGVRAAAGPRPITVTISPRSRATIGATGTSVMGLMCSNMSAVARILAGAQWII